MKKLLLLLSLVVFGQNDIQSQNWLWAKCALGPSNSTSYGEGWLVATDTISDNFYISGFFTMPYITLGTITLTNTGPDYTFIAKCNSLGNVIWAKKMDASVADISVDIYGNLLLTGTFGAFATFDSDTLFNVAPSMNFSDMFVAKCDSSGNFKWAKGVGGVRQENGNNIASDKNGNIFIFGSFNSDTIRFDPSHFIHDSIDAFGLSAVVTAKYDSAGNFLWANASKYIGFEAPCDMAIDNLGNSYITGTFKESTVTFEPYVLSNGGGGSQGPDIFLVKYSAAGNILWAKGFGGTGYDYGSGIVVNSVGNVVLAGGYGSHNIHFGTYNLINNSNPITFPNESEIFLANFDTAGNVLWAKSYGGYDSEIASCIAADPFGNVYFNGAFNTVGFNFGTHSVSFPSGGSDAMFILKSDNNGTELCASVLGSGADDQCDLACDKRGNLYMCGDYTKFVNPFVLGNDTLINNGTNENVFYAKYICQTSPADMQNNLNNTEIAFFPNPTSDQFYIEAYTTDKLTVDLYDVNGRHVFSTSVSDKSNINVTTLDNGIYTLTIKTTGRVINKKLAIVR